MDIISGPWPFWISGAGIGLFVVLFAWAQGNTFGVSSGFSELCQLKGESPSRWKLVFILGIPLGALAASLLRGGPSPSFKLGLIERALGSGALVKAAALFAGGLCIGFGARQAGGCTSGHAIQGVARGAKASIIVTAGFMLAGVLVTQLLNALGA